MSPPEKQTTFGKTLDNKETTTGSLHSSPLHNHENDQSLTTQDARGARPPRTRTISEAHSEFYATEDDDDDDDDENNNDVDNNDDSIADALAAHRRVNNNHNAKRLGRRCRCCHRNRRRHCHSRSCCCCCCCCHSPNSRTKTWFQSVIPTDGSSVGAISNLCSATLGAGVLSLPYAFSHAGLIPGILLLLFAGLATVRSIDLLVDSCHETNLPTYEALTIHLYGMTSGCVVEGCILIFCFGCAVAYIVAVGDILEQGVIGVLQDDLPRFLNDRNVIMILFWIAVMFPLSLYERINSLRFASMFGIGSIAFLILVVVVHSIQDMIGGGAGFDMNDDDGVERKWGELTSVQLWPHSFWDVIRACPIVIFAFSCQINVCAIFYELKTPPNDDDLDNDEGIEGGGRARARACVGESMSERENNIVSNGLIALEEANNEEERHRDKVTPHHSSIASSPNKVAAMAWVTRSGVAVCFIFFILVGIFGYLDFGSDVQDNVLKNYCVHDTRDPLVISAFIFVTLAVVVGFPLNVFPARVTLEGVIDRISPREGGTDTTENFGNCEDNDRTSLVIRGGAGDGAATTLMEHTRSKNEEQDDNHGNHNDHGDFSDYVSLRELREPLLAESWMMGVTEIGESGTNADTPVAMYPTSSGSRLRHVLLTIIVSGSALLMALVVPDISVIFGFMGGTASSVVCFIMPGLFALRTTSKLQEEDEQKRSEGTVQEDGDQHIEEDFHDEVPDAASFGSLHYFSRKVANIPWGKIEAWALVWAGAAIGILSTGLTMYDVFYPTPTHGTCSGDLDDDLPSPQNETAPTWWYSEE